MVNMVSEADTTQALKRRTVKLVDQTKRHPRETFDEAVSRLLQDHRVLEEIRRKDPELVDSAVHAAGLA